MSSKKSILGILFGMVLLLNIGYVSINDLDTISNQPNLVNGEKDELVRIWNVNLSSEDVFFPTTVGPNGNTYVIKSQYPSPGVYCFDRDGRLRWKYEEINKTHLQISNPVFGEHGNIYFFHKEGGKDTCTLSALNRSGHLLWKEKILNGSFRSEGPLAVPGEGIYVASSSGYIYKFDEKGEKKFTRDISNSSLRILGEIKTDLYLFGSSEKKNRLIKTDLKGQVEWKVTVHSNYSLSEYSIGESIYLGLKEEVNPISWNSTIRSYSKDGEKIWSHPLGQDTLLNSMGYENEGLYFGYSDLSDSADGDTTREEGHVVALNPNSAEVRWNFSYEYGPGEMFEDLLIEENSIYTYVWDSSYGKEIVSEILCFDSDGTLRSQLSVTNKEIKSFCVGNSGIFYAVTEDANLSAFKLDREKPVAEAGDDITTEAGDKTFLDASNSTDDTVIANYTWRVKENSYYGPTLNYTFSEPGTYNVSLTVEDKAGRKDSDRITVKVQEKEDGFIPGFTFPIIAVGIFVALIYTWRTKIT